MDTTKPAAALLSNQRDEDRHEDSQNKQANQLFLVFVHLIDYPALHGLHIRAYAAQVTASIGDKFFLVFRYHLNASHYFFHVHTISNDKTRS
ncbi:hypothetical protein VSR96_23045 [Klebsiella pneumoniae]|uniref:hypothetical protein n=1 Tax=Klebsiella pneumoniae TaxID=573 RepID=UPI002DBF3D12|nr:hypothetical protein [Klebsiella pneumoniae]MEC4459226.1 hypothetical protein [Klebsiella pneumoniae]HDO7110989.1 hypothetical protein [Klebsiella pneumoniae]